MTPHSIRLSKGFWSLALVLTMGLAAPFGEEEGGEEEDKAEVAVDTCGKLAGRMVTLSKSTTRESFNRGNERFTTGFSVDRLTLTKKGKSFDTAYESLLQWTSSTFGNGVGAPDGPEVKARKNSLLIWCGSSPAEFIYHKDGLRMAPGFRKEIIRGLEKNSSGILGACLYEVLDGSAWPDRHILQVLRLYGIREVIRDGAIDASLDSLKALAEDPADDTIARYCKRLSDSLTAAKKAEQPVSLEGARKVGTIMGDPVYPPLDSPTVFWQDALLGVVQEEGGKPRMMRTFDPRSGKWGKKVPVRFPETAMSQLFEKNTGTWSHGCVYEVYCWRKKLGEFNEDPCDGLECSPLMMLDDSSGGSVENLEDRRRAGGSCAAGEGRFEFTGAGTLRRMGDAKVVWNILPGEALRGERKYAFELTREYPVTVSPDQKWIAYALAAKDGKSKELWVARLKYKD